MSLTLDYLESASTYSAIVIGPGGSGKTAFVWSMLDTVLDGDVMIYGYPKEMINEYPRHISKRLSTFIDWGDIASREGIVLLDDSLLVSGARSFSSRESKDIQANMSIARHHNWRIWWTVQNTALLDKLAWQALETVMFHKLMSPESIWTEREELIEDQLKANLAISYSVVHTGADPRSLIYCSRFDEVLQLPLPSWWNDTISKPYRRCYVRDGQIVRV